MCDGIKSLNAADYETVTIAGANGTGALIRLCFEVAHPSGHRHAFWRTSGLMGASIRMLRLGLAVLLACGSVMADDFEWNWRDQQVISRNDTSVGNTSKLSETNRTALIDSIVLRLQKPMSEQGYDDQRIREIASITRLRFNELKGDGKSLLIAGSIGLEAGCDGAGNCPMWIFRRDKAAGEYVSVLDTQAASYTIQPTSTNGVPDLVTLRRKTPMAGTLTLYQFSDGKYVDAGCYTATWPAAKSDEEIQDPEVLPCKGEEAAKPEASPSAEPVKGEASSSAEPAKAESSESAAPAKAEEPARRPSR